MLPLERDNITLEQNISSTLRNNTFIEMFVSGKDSQKGKYLLEELDMNSKLEEDQMEWLDDDLMDNNINDNEKELLDDLTEEYTEKYEKLFNHYLNEGFSEEEAIEKADKKFSEEFENEDNIESEDDADINCLDDEKLLRLIKNNLREFTFKSNIKTTTFTNETNFLKFLPKMNEKTSLSIINNWQASNLLMISEIGNQWKTGDYLISLRFLDKNSSYEEDEEFSPYFNFKTIIYECLYHANLGLYSHLFRITKAASLKSKEFLKEFNGFSRARNLLDILRFESSYDIIKTDTYKIFHDCSEFNIERELSKNEKVFDLIEKRLTAEKTKQEKNVSDVVSLGLAVISILTIGLAAADVTNFLGFKDLFNNDIKILIISLPVIIFLIYLRVSLIRVKKLEDK